AGCTARYGSARHLGWRGACEARDESDGDVEALAVDGAGRNPQRVVLHVRDVVRREDALARQVQRIGTRGAAEDAALERILRVRPVAALQPQLEFYAAELRERIAGQEISAVGDLLVHVECDIAEQAAEAEDAGAVVES